MPSTIDARLAELGIVLPDAPAPAANYIPFTVAGGLVFVSGQISRDETGLITGRLGDGVTVEGGYAAARTCALALIAQARAAAGGDLDRVRVVKLTGFVNSSPDFTDQPKVVNGASDLMVEIFGEEKGRHSRAAVGVAALPLGVAVEVEGIFALA